MHDPDLTPEQDVRNRAFIEASARVQQDSSSESVHAYLNALANVTFLCPMKESAGGVEIYVTHLRPSTDPLVPVFTSFAEYEAFGSVIPRGYSPSSIAAVSMCRLAIDLFPETTTLAIDPARPNFFRVPPNLIRIIASSEQQPNDTSDAR
jgi:hypothetical protein